MISKQPFNRSIFELLRIEIEEPVGRLSCWKKIRMKLFTFISIVFFQRLADIFQLFFFYWDLLEALVCRTSHFLSTDVSVCTESMKIFAFCRHLNDLNAGERKWELPKWQVIWIAPHRKKYSKCVGTRWMQIEFAHCKKKNLLPGNVKTKWKAVTIKSFRPCLPWN